MQIVIDIEEGRYNWIMSHASNDPRDYANTTDIVFRKAVESGTVLPKGHGRITDLDEIIRFTYATYGIGSGKSITKDNKDFIDYIYNDAPVLVEADNSESEE